MLWLIIGLTVARADLLQARQHGSTPVQALAQADIAALQAHADESLTLIDNSGERPEFVVPSFQSGNKL